MTYAWFDQLRDGLKRGAEAQGRTVVEVPLKYTTEHRTLTPEQVERGLRFCGFNLPDKPTLAPILNQLAETGLPWAEYDKIAAAMAFGATVSSMSPQCKILIELDGNAFDRKVMLYRSRFADATTGQVCKCGFCGEFVPEPMTTCPTCLAAMERNND